ncbi:MAG TPA: sugar ABC transporter substrate-binding protein [Candidatus Binatia bacterium]|nr:sugar ABC transporter substrate-binding protein [Candidatus Binatia bacterium]
MTAPRHLALGVLLLVAVPACRRDARPALRFWALGREGEVVAQLLPEFERRHPGLRVRVQQIPWSAAHEKLLTAFVGGAMPDVLQVGNTWLPELVALGALEPLDERLARSAAMRTADYFPGILAANLIDGVTYGVPWYVDTRLLFYRTDLLAAAGLARPPPTWAGWVAAMVRMQAAAGPGSWAILLPAREWEPLVILGLQWGADLLRDDARYGDFRSPAFRAAFTFYLEFFRRGLAPPGETAVANVYQDFARGAFSVYLTGPWNLGEFARRLPAAARDRWSTAPLPSPDGEYPGASLAGGASLVIARGSRRQNDAWALVEYLAEPAQQARFYQLTGDLPARQSAWRAAALPDDPRAGAFWLQLQHVRSTPKIPEWERIASAIAHYGEAAIRGDMGIDGALEALDRDVDGVLAKRRWLLERAGG